MFLLQKHFVDVSLGEEFLALELRDVLEITSRDELYVSSEEKVRELRDVWCMTCCRPRQGTSSTCRPRKRYVSYVTCGA